jgi:prepilin-type N-terminal cleavage/methylation domain-containing protein
MKKNAFTLVEMLVVIAIIILISVSAIPAITPFLKGQRLSKGARIVQAQALAARTMAINSRKARWLVLDSINYKLSIKDETGSIVLGKEEFLPDTIEFVTSTGTWIAGTSTVSFDPDGTATSNLDADTITIQDKQGNTKKLKIITYTGQIISD